MAEVNVNDIAFQTILDISKTVTPALPESLLRQIYAIQFAHQFDRERDSSLQKMQQLLDNFIDLSSGTGGITK